MSLSIHFVIQRHSKLNNVRQTRALSFISINEEEETQNKIIMMIVEIIITGSLD